MLSSRMANASKTVAVWCRITRFHNWQVPKFKHDIRRLHASRNNQDDSGKYTAAIIREDGSCRTAVVQQRIISRQSIRGISTSNLRKLKAENERPPKKLSTLEDFELLYKMTKEKFRCMILFCFHILCFTRYLFRGVSITLINNPKKAKNQELCKPGPIWLKFGG